MLDKECTGVHCHNCSTTLKWRQNEKLPPPKMLKEPIHYPHNWKRKGKKEGLPISQACPAHCPALPLLQSRVSSQLAARPLFYLESANSRQEGKENSWGEGRGYQPHNTKNGKACVFRTQRTQISDLMLGRAAQSDSHNKWGCEASVSRATGNYRVPRISIDPLHLPHPPDLITTHIEQIQNH